MSSMNFISAFLKDVLDFIFNLVGNYGWSVVIFTLLIRLVLMPLDIKSKQSMKRMSALQPQIDALNKKYAKDKEKLNQKMSDLYRKEKINPLSGCLPMLIQLPILFCMFTAMRVVANEHTVQMLLDMMNGTFNPDSFQSWLWIKNVYQPDSFFSTIIPAIADPLSMISGVTGSSVLTMENLESVRAFLATPEYAAIAAQYGASSYIYTAPMLFWTISIPAQFNGLFILPVLAGASQYLSSKLLSGQQTPAANSSAASTNRMMQVFFPIFSVWICATSTAAFSIYWVAINIIQIAQQYLMNVYFDRKEAKKPEEVAEP